VDCPESLSVEAHFDGELPPSEAQDIERHLEHCAECRARHADWVLMRTAIRRNLPSRRAPEALRQRVLASVAAAEGAQSPLLRERPRYKSWRSPPFWLGVASGFGGAVAVALLAVLVILPLARRSLAEQVLAAHLDSLTSTHLIDVESTDRHTVKPWFAGHTEVSPVVADFTTQGYTLLGGRVDLIARQHVAVLVYRHAAHVINVFCWLPGPTFKARNLTRDGYHLAFWRTGDLAYAAVSDVGWDELLEVEGLIRAAGSQDTPP
jgi:anti-sigma factor RsiW